MKYRITYNELKRHYQVIFACNYCKIKYINLLLNAESYNSGVNGWNYDIYSFGKYAISTGYQPKGQKLSEYVIMRINDISRDYYKAFQEQRITFEQARTNCIMEIELLLSHVEKGDII